MERKCAGLLVLVLLCFEFLGIFLKIVLLASKGHLTMPVCIYFHLFVFISSYFVR